jgi:hypothetical protein
MRAREDLIAIDRQSSRARDLGMTGASVSSPSAKLRHSLPCGWFRSGSTCDERGHRRDFAHLTTLFPFYDIRRERIAPGQSRR